MSLATEMGYAEAVAWLEDRFSKYLGKKTDVPPGPLAASFDYDPFIFGGKFPVQSVEDESGASYRGGSDKSRLPGMIPIAVRFYDVSLKLKRRPGPNGVLEVGRDARSEAKRRCRDLFSLWYEELRKDREMKRLSSVEVVLLEAGDADAFGNERIDETGKNVLWCLKASVEVMP